MCWFHMLLSVNTPVTDVYSPCMSWEFQQGSFAGGKGAKTGRLTHPGAKVWAIISVPSLLLAVLPLLPP